MASGPDLAVVELLVRLADASVDFVVVGGIAVVVHGYERTTKDLDVVPSQDPENLAALGQVLVDLNARLRGIEEEVPFVADERTLRQMRIVTLDTDLGGVDVLLEPSGSPPYGELRARATAIDVDTRRVLIASIDDLLAMKRAAGRGQDLVDVEALETIKRMRRFDV